MPINPGDIQIVSRNLVRHAAEGIDSLTKFLLAEDKRKTLETFAATEVSFNAFHGERYRQAPTAEGALLAARSEFDIVVPTLTPVDRWMAKLAGRRNP